MTLLALVAAPACRSADGAEPIRPAPAVATPQPATPAAAGSTAAPSAPGCTATRTRPPVALSTAAYGKNLLVDTSGLYLARTTGETTEVVRLGKDGASATVLASSPVATMAMDETSLYWRSGDDLVALPKAGGAPKTIASFRGSVFALDATDVYAVAGPENEESVVRFSKQGGPLATLATPTSTVMTGIAVDGESVYVADEDRGDVHRIPKQGGPSVKMMAGQYKPHTLAVDDTHVFWTFRTISTLMQVPKGDGEPIGLSRELAPDSPMAITSWEVYAAEPGALVKVWKRGNATTKLASHPPEHPMTAIGLDERCVYYATLDPGSGKTTVWALGR